MPLHIKGLDFVKVKKDCEGFHLNYGCFTLRSGCCGSLFLIVLTGQDSIPVES
ncbi:hypothetical protein SAMN05444673_6584 [Bacillus sp. OV166]|nr:hypothetical protein SAMN05444673_6584 [Bacillus sp. OV166]